jgi:aspartate/methionine/tyrosine aminotransferase
MLNDSPNWGRDDLRKIISDMHEETSIHNVLITTGTSEALFLLFRYLNPKSIALAMPAFQLLYEIPMALNAKIIPLPVYWNKSGAPYIEEDEWLKIIKTQKPECILINNPHNPSGLVFEDHFLKKIQTLSEEIKCNLIGDEHYRFLSHETNTLGNSLFKNNNRTFITGSFIKCFGVPGLRIGWCVGPHKALSHIQNEKNYTTHTVNPITEWISYEVLKNFNSNLFKNIKEEWLQNKAYLTKFLENSDKFIGISPQGGLVTSIGFKFARNKLETLEQIYQLNNKGVFVLPLHTMEFGSFGYENSTTNEKLSPINEGHGFRLGLGCSTEKFKEALQIMHQ